MTALERAARAIAEVDEKTHRRLNMYGVHKDRYDEYVRAVLMAIVQTLKRYDSDQAGQYEDERGNYVLFDDLDAILNEKDTTND